MVSPPNITPGYPAPRSAAPPPANVLREKSPEPGVVKNSAVPVINPIYKSLDAADMFVVTPAQFNIMQFMEEASRKKSDVAFVSATQLINTIPVIMPLNPYLPLL